jgi:myosin-light-chain kinase
MFSIGGGELFDRVIEEEFVLSELACCIFMKQILEGVHYIHTHNIIHLDLKVRLLHLHEADH